MSSIHVIIHFLAPINKTFTFTEPDILELGRFSGIIQDPAISKKQVCFEITDGRVYATSLGANWMMRGTEKIRKNNKIEIHDGNQGFLPSFNNDGDREYDAMETPSQLLREMISSQGDLDTIPDDDHDNILYNDDRESSDNGADIHDSDNSDSIKSIESDNEIISSESSFLGSSCESSESVIDD
ncbi:2392_t:CDS:2 [Cetraspora pellucida]|uniref:2392_t:CDS:1 n=1 Tax=Cetraspora pellucida TaxID=1433469 RepID=A0A9N9BSZ9_9GLOM|nr:2392_t:CDS:2 [Cetraspora pellucida]